MPWQNQTNLFSKPVENVVFCVNVICSFTYFQNSRLHTVGRESGRRELFGAPRRTIRYFGRLHCYPYQIQEGATSVGRAFAYKLKLQHYSKSHQLTKREKPFGHLLHRKQKLGHRIDPCYRIK